MVNSTPIESLYVCADCGCVTSESVNHVCKKGQPKSYKQLQSEITRLRGALAKIDVEANFPPACTECDSTETLLRICKTTREALKDGDDQPLGVD